MRSLPNAHDLHLKIYYEMIIHRLIRFEILDAVFICV